jgi:hypothetical protein
MTLPTNIESSSLLNKNSTNQLSTLSNMVYTNHSIIVNDDEVYVVSNEVIVSSFTTTPSSIISFNIGDSNSKIIVNGNATFNGALKLNFNDGYIPQDGDTITLMEYYNHTGQFDDVCC